MKKFYCFKQGQDLPKWLWDFNHNDRESEFKNKGGRVVFGVSCIAVRERGKQTKLIPARVGDDACYVYIKGFDNSEHGGINGASGVCLFDFDNLHAYGEGMRYVISNSKVVQVNQ